MKVKILIIAFADSIHTSRWMAQLDRSLFEVHLFPAVLFQSVHEDIQDAVVYMAGTVPGEKNRHATVQYESAGFVLQKAEQVLGRKLFRRLILKYAGSIQEKMLQKIIRRIQPGLIHTMETQHAGYLYESAGCSSAIPWIHSTWGIDLHYYKNITGHKTKLIKLLQDVSLLITEGKRDEIYARELGFTGKTIIMPSVGGGFNFSEFDSLPPQVPASERKKIIIKGYEGEERLASNALLALRKIRGLLAAYEIIVYSCNERLLPLMETIRNEDKLTISHLKDTSRRVLLELTADSRLSITNNLSDGVPNTMLEAMALGAFPIQSDTAITDGWIQDGVNGLLTQPRSADSIATAISTALNNDELVNNAGVYNRNLVREKLDISVVKQRIDNIYLETAGNIPTTN